MTTLVEESFIGRMTSDGITGRNSILREFCESGVGEKTKRVGERPLELEAGGEKRKIRYARITT